LKLLTVGTFAASPIYVFVDDNPPLRVSKSPELPELVFRVLTTILGGNSGING
jgi:hypothetical protein